jgi:hypothetical protein
VAGIFSRLAYACFALVGALLLRVATQDNWLPPLVGTAIGLTYCIALLSVPHLLERRGIPLAAGTVLQFCGLLLAPLIILEMVHKLPVLSLSAATLLLVGVTFSASLIAVWTRRRSLAATSVSTAVIGILALGLSPDAALLRSLALLAVVGWALWLAHTCVWHVLRPLTLPIVSLSLGLAVMMAARRPEIPSEIALSVFLCCLGLWLGLAVHHWLRRRVLGILEAAWLPVASLWFFGVALFYAPALTPPAAALIAAAIFGLVAWRSRAAVDRARWLTGLAIAATLLGAPALALLEPSGLAVAGLAVIVWAEAATLRSEALAVTVVLVALLAVVLSQTTGNLLVVERVSAAGMARGLGTAVVLFTHGWIAGRQVRLSSRGHAARWLAPVSLAGAVAVLFTVCRAGAFLIWGAGDAYQLAQSLLLALLAVAALSLSRGRMRQTWLVLGLIGVALLALKVVFHDLFSLAAPFAVAATVALGGTFVIASLTLRRHKAAGEPSRSMD